MLPISLKSFTINNFRGIKHTSVEEIPDNTQWIFLTGENGFGKTSVLQALALGINPQKAKAATINLKTEDKFLVEEIESKLDRASFKINLIKYLTHKSGAAFRPTMLVAYGSTRLRISAGTSLEVIEKYSSTNSLFWDDTLLINVEENFKNWDKMYQEGFDQLEQIFKTLIPSLAKIRVEFDEKLKRNVVKYYEADNEGNVYPEGIEFLQLAAGYKNILAMVGDMVNRFIPQDQTLKDFRGPNAPEGIVLIDEIDLHLHPKYQKLFVQQLSKLFPNTLFIASTHSPIPLLGAPHNSVVINVSRTKEDGIKAELLDVDFSVLTPNSILSSPILVFKI